MAKKLSASLPGKFDISKSSVKVDSISFSDEIRSFSIESVPVATNVGTLDYVFDIGSIQFFKRILIVGLRCDVVVQNTGLFRRVIGSRIYVQGNSVSLPVVPRIGNSLVDSALSTRFTFATASGNNYIPCAIEIKNGNFDTEFNVRGIDTQAGQANDEAIANLTIFYRELK